MKTCFQNLSTELLIQIFEYCDVKDLFELQKTCSRFYEIIKKATGLGNSDPLLVTNQLRQELRCRCVEFLTIKEKCRITNNWRRGVYKESFMLKQRKICMPCLVLTRDYLWLSNSNCIRAYKRKQHSLEVQNASYSITTPLSIDVCKFTFKQNCLISGQQDGSIHIWKPNDSSIKLQNCHESDINSVDLEGEVFVSGSKDKYIKVWLQPDEKLQEECEPIYKYNMNDRVWSTALSKANQYLAVGTAGHNSVLPLHIFDLNRCMMLQEFGHDFAKGSGILQIKWESPFTLLTCGYDTNIRKWDTRTGMCEQSWEDPFYCTVYCFETDNYCTILTGTQSHGRVVLWDTRSINYVQMYFMESCKRGSFSSPIYSLSFDACQLFAATDRCLNILDFSIKKGVNKDYGSFKLT